MQQNNPIKLGVLMDPVDTINVKKDSTYAMLKEAQQYGWKLYYFTKTSLYANQDQVFANAKQLIINHNHNPWYELSKPQIVNLNNFDIILFRLDPPFDLEYLYITYLLELVQNQNTLIINNPKSIRDCNEKLFCLKFKNLIPDTIVTNNNLIIKDFIKKHKAVILKPLNGMGGRGVFKIDYKNSNTNVIIETATNFGITSVMVQKFIPDISAGDKRILLINGIPIEYGVARLPNTNEYEHRGNLAALGSATGFKLSKQDKFICETIGPTLKKLGLYFVGIDVIGDYLTEINVTCPTCIQEIDENFDLNISKVLFNQIKTELKSSG